MLKSVFSLIVLKIISFLLSSSYFLLIDSKHCFADERLWYLTALHFAERESKSFLTIVDSDEMQKVVKCHTNCTHITICCLLAFTNHYLRRNINMRIIYCSFSCSVKSLSHPEEMVVAFQKSVRTTWYLLSVLYHVCKKTQVWMAYVWNNRSLVVNITPHCWRTELFDSYPVHF